jgi:hypothetical protein
VSLDKAKEKLEEDEAKAEEEAELLAEAAAKISARIKRIRTQKRFLRVREKEMLRRGLASLDELDALEEEERLASNPVETLPVDFDASREAPMDSEGLLDPVSFDFPSPGNVFWASHLEPLDIDGGTPQASQGS